MVCMLPTPSVSALSLLQVRILFLLLPSAHQHPSGYGGLDHYYNHATAHTLHSTPVEVYVLLGCMSSTASLSLCFHALTLRTYSEP